MTAAMQAAIRKIVDGQSLGEQEAFSVASAIMAGQATPAGEDRLQLQV